MPWRECHEMDERLRFVARLLEGEKNSTALASSVVDKSVLIFPLVAVMFTGKENPGAGPGSKKRSVR